MYVPPVLLAVDGHTPDTHLSAGSEHPDGDLSPVGHQDLLDGLDSAPRHLRGEVGGGGGQRDTWDWPPCSPGQGLGHLGDHLVWSLDFPQPGFSLNWSVLPGCICVRCSIFLTEPVICEAQHEIEMRTWVDIRSDVFRLLHLHICILKYSHFNDIYCLEFVNLTSK